MTITKPTGQAESGVLRVAVDGYFMDDERTGMGVVSLNQLREVSRLPGAPHFDILAPRAARYSQIRALDANTISVIELPDSPFPYWEQITMRRWANANRPHLCWFPYNTAPLRFRGDYLVTVHDLIYLDGAWYDQPTAYKKLGKLYRRIVAPRAARRANRILSVSNYSAGVISDRLAIENSRISVAHPGTVLNPAYEQVPGLLAFLASKPFILAAGSLEPRKNVDSLLRAYRACRQSTPLLPTLVLYGFRGFSGSRIESLVTELGLEEAVAVLPYVSEEAKWWLYSHAEYFVFPSLIEGFGIPVIEAFASDCAVITTTRGALGEIAGDAALTVDPTSVESICAAMKQLHEDVDLRKSLARAGLERCKSFSWRESAVSVLRAMRDAAGDHSDILNREFGNA